MSGFPYPADTANPWHGRAVLHVDLDAFFAAVEQLDHPEWRGKPVIVGGSPTGRGVVSTCSYEARVYGVRSAMSSARAAALCPDAIWAPSRFGRYKELSDAVFAIFRDESPFVAPVSVDEAYLDITPGEHSAEHPIAIAERIRARIAELGITGSGGLATSRTVAKIASDHEKPDALTVVWPGFEAEFLAPLPVRALPGIGPKSAERLIAFGVRTLGELAALDDATASQLLGSHGRSTVLRAAGIDERPVTGRDPAKSVSAERTFSTDIRERTEVEQAIMSLATRVARRLRRKELAGRTVTVKLRYSDFTTKTVRQTMSHGVDDEAELARVATELVRGAWSPGVGVRLLGVGVSGFHEGAEQLDLLATLTDPAAEQPEQRRTLVKGLDAVRERFGDTSVLSGRELLKREERRPIDEEQDVEEGR